MYCKYCGRQIADDSKFCEFCGELVQKTPVVETAPVDSAESIGEPIVKDTGFAPIPPVMQEEEQVVEEPTRVVPRAEPLPEEDEEEELPQEPKKQISKPLLWGLIGGGAGLVALITLILVLVLNKPPVKVDVTQYLDFKVSGYDGYGVAVCELDTDALERAALGEYPAGNDAKSRKAQVEYKEKAALLKGAVTLEFEKQKNLSVGDKLSASVRVDRSVEKELGIEFSTNLVRTYTVTDQDLSGSMELDVLNEFYALEFEGFSGDAIAKIVVKERKEEFYFTTHDGTEYTVEPAVETATGPLLLKLHNEDGTTEILTLECTLSAKEKLENDNEVKLTLGKEVKGELMQYGLSLKAEEISVKVEKLDTLVTELSQLDLNIVDGWVETYEEKLEKYLLANWNDLLHGGNVLASTTVEIESLTPCARMIASGKGGNALFVVYSAVLSDEVIMLGNYGNSMEHFLAVKIENIILDAEGKLREDQLKLPQDSGEGYSKAYTVYEDLYKATAGTYESVSE